MHRENNENITVEGALETSAAAAVVTTGAVVVAAAVVVVAAAVVKATPFDTTVEAVAHHTL